MGRGWVDCVVLRGGMGSVRLGYATAFIPISSAYEDRFVLQGCFRPVSLVDLVDEVGEGGVALDEHGWGYADGEETAEFRDSVVFMLAAAIGEEDEGDAEALEESEGFASARERAGGAKKDAVDAAEVERC